MSDQDLADGTIGPGAPGSSAFDDDELGAGLPALARHDVGADTAARIRGLALATLRRRERPRLAQAWAWYERAFEPTIWVGLGLGYCVWAAAGALAVLH
jgi:hypothetical protein